MAPKRWGPFTGRHLTTMFIALVIGAVAVPITAQATSTGQDVVITDPSASPERYAKVDANGKLQVSDAHLRTDAFGNLKVASQYGVVTARSANLDDAFHGSKTLGLNDEDLAIAGAVRVVVTSLHVTMTDVDTGETAQASQRGYFTGWHPGVRAFREWVEPQQEIGPQLERLGIRRPISAGS